MPLELYLAGSSRRAPDRGPRAKRSAPAGVFLAVASFASVALAGPGVSSTRISDMPAGAYVSDQAHTSVTAKLLHLGFSNYTLRFDRVDAQFRFDPSSPGTSRLVVSIDPASIDTGAKGFDAQLAGKDWFDAEDFPTITFVSDSIDPGDGQRGTVTGTLTIHGVAKPVTLAVVYNGVGGDIIPLVTRVGFSANTTIKRSDFGLTRFPGLVGDDVQLVIEIEFTRKLL